MALPFWLPAVLSLVFSIAPALAVEPKIAVDAVDFDRMDAPMTASIEPSGLEPGRIELVADDGTIRNAQADLEEESPRALVVRWIEPSLPAKQRRTFTLRPTPRKSVAFHFRDGDGWRDLLFADQPVWRDMVKYDPMDRTSTFKPFRHVYGVDGESFITKGAGGKFTHHRGIFFGFKASEGDTQLGDFWHCPDVTQRHVRYVADGEFAGPVAARSRAITEWVGKDGQSSIIRDTRTTTTWRIGDEGLVLDYDIMVQSTLGKPLKLFADAHHGGFHFRAGQEVADAPGPDGKPGAAVYLRPVNARDTGNDIWSDCSWIECQFSVADHAYRVTLLDHPSNPRPTTFSTRPYGRFGAYFQTKVSSETPLHLRYRLLIRPAGDSARAEAERIAEAEHDYRLFAGGH